MNRTLVQTMGLMYRMTMTNSTDPLRTTVSLPADLAAAIRAEALDEDRSLSYVIARVVRWAIAHGYRLDKAS